jgi:hypothetical protein
LRERFRALLGDEKLLPVNFSAALRRRRMPRRKRRIFLKPHRRKNRRNPGKSEIGNPHLGADRLARRLARDARRPVHFVNRRPVENRGINYALIEGYHNR